MFSALLILAASAGPVGAQPEVRSLPRDQGAGPTTLEPAALAPLFTEGPASQVAECLAQDEAARCQSELADWVVGHPGHPNLAEARFLLGYLAHEAGDDATAVAELSAAATAVAPLADLARYFASVSAYRMGDWDAAIALAEAVDLDSVYGPRARFLLGKSLRRAGRYLESATVLRQFVDTHPNAFYIAEVEIELARALEQLGDLEGAAHFYHRVSVRYPGSDEEEAADDALAAVLALLPESARATYERVDDEDLLVRATVLFDRHRSEQVIELLEDELDRLDRATPLGCQAAFLVAKSYRKLRRHSDSIPVFASIFEGGCPDEDIVVKALYLAGRALWNVDRDEEAADLFRRLYSEHESHSYADDAMLYEARIERANGHETAFLQRLEEQVRRFPQGDMLGDANWLLFEHDFSNGHYADAIAFADAVANQTGENSLYNRGRLAYFRARALELDGQRDAALDGYEAVALEVPLSYYALLAINRLLDRDSQRGSALLERLRPDSADALDAGGPSLVIEPAQVAEDDAFRSGLLLLRLGLLELAQQQFDRLTDTYPNQDNLLWLLSFLFDQAGAYHISHDIPRRRISAFLTAYPTAETLEHWRLAYPVPFGELVAEAAEERDLDPYLVYAIMREESGFNPRAESWANARGLMQLMERTAESMADRIGRRRVGRSDLFRPDVALELGSEYLSLLSQRYGGHPALVIAGYNGGEGNVDRWLGENGDLPLDRFVEEINYRQTRDYTKRVLMTYWIYRWLYDPDRPMLELPFDLRPDQD